MLGQEEDSWRSHPPFTHMGRNSGLGLELFLTCALYMLQLFELELQIWKVLTHIHTHTHTSRERILELNPTHTQGRSYDNANFCFSHYFPSKTV